VVGEVPAGADLADLLNVHGQGRCAITLDPHDRQPGQQPYQGVVPLHGDRREPLQKVQQVLEHYMLQSEQLDTRLVLAANDEVAAGLLDPAPAGARRWQPGRAPQRRRHWPVEDFNRIAMLAATLTSEELLTLDRDQILHRLFWEERCACFEPLQPRFACSCSRERVRGMLRGLGREESDSLIHERGQVEVGCEFCGAQYRFDAVDVGEMFTPPRDQPPIAEGMH
jgi:molecular chaperone Hsp33